NSNTFTNLNVNTSGNVTFLTRAGNMTATGSENINSNSIVTAFNKGAAGGTLTFFDSSGLSVNGSTMTNNLNNFSNVTVKGSTIIAGWNNIEGASSSSGPAKTITNNTFNNITANTTPTGTITGMTVDFSGPGTSVTSNTISNITGGAAITGLMLGGSNQSITASGNLIDPITSSGSAAVTAISTSATTETISTHKIYDLSGSNAGSTVSGLLVSAGSVTVSNNLIGNLTASAATGSNAINGINITSTTSSSTIKVYYNTVYVSNPASGAGFGSSGIFTAANNTATTATLDLRNN